MFCMNSSASWLTFSVMLESSRRFFRLAFGGRSMTVLSSSAISKQKQNRDHNRRNRRCDTDDVDKRGTPFFFSRHFFFFHWRRGSLHLASLPFTNDASLFGNGKIHRRKY